MGLTYKSTGKDSLKEIFKIEKKKDEFIVALAGNPNTGKSTVFNALTGLHQHTGNWPGKTVANARGKFITKEKDFVVVDLPGTYSLFSSSEEERVARDFLCFGNADAVIVVTDATCLERNLNLVFQIMEMKKNVILCINLIDEARKKDIIIDKEGISKELGIPVITTAARSGEGIDELKKIVYNISAQKEKISPIILKYEDKIEEKVNELSALIVDNVNNVNVRWLSLRLIDGEEGLITSIKKEINDVDWEKINHVLINERDKKCRKNKSLIRESIMNRIYNKAEEINKNYVQRKNQTFKKYRKIDNYITSRIFGIPIMLSILAIVLWLTLTGANYPSQMLANLLFSFEDKLASMFNYFEAPNWLYGILVLGLYRTLAWVISVMLPPMAIFFPLFTLLEDLGYLPRVAFNLDHLFKKACAHGKQCLTMCMGLGCNAAGVIGCRIIDSPRERLVAILTNNFIPCNGRFPTLIAIASVFLVTKNTGSLGGILPALAVTAMVVIGILISLLVSYILSKTLLKGVPSSFSLELPPYRKPQVARVIYTSIIDRTMFVLGRAIVIAAPAGAITWILGNVYIGDISIIQHMAAFLQPLANLMGLDGYILMAFILGLPANEIVLPILLMAYLSTGTLIEFDSIESLRQILIGHGWTYLTALNTMLFSLLHWPCGTTIMTIKKETGSIKWTIIGTLIPTFIGIIVCMITTAVWRMIF